MPSNKTARMPNQSKEQPRKTHLDVGFADFAHKVVAIAAPHAFPAE
jgi:hypothetical protein